MGQTRNLRDGQITVKDGAAASVVLTLENGDLTYEIRKDHKRIRDRGALDHTRPGDEQETKLSFSVMVDRVSEATTPVTLHDALMNVRSASTWVSSGAAHEPYQVDIEFKVLDPAGGADDETITFTKFHVESITPAEGDDANTIEVSGFAFITDAAYT